MNISRPIAVGGGGGNFFWAYFFGGRFFLYALFCKLFFHKSDITCIVTVVGAQQQHKGMFLKHGAGEGAKIFQQYHGGGGDFFPTYSEGGGALFFSSIDFAEPPGHK